jgi:hypothetical protein
MTNVLFTKPSFQPASKYRPTASFPIPPGPEARKPTGGLPKQPAHVARLGQKAAQQPLEAAPARSRPILPDLIRRFSLHFGGIKDLCAAGSPQTLVISFLLPVQRLLGSQRRRGGPAAGLCQPR